MTRLFLSTLLIIAALLGPYSHAKTINYDELNGLATLATKVKSPYSNIRAWLTLNDDALKLQDVDIWLQRDGQRIASLAVAEDGAIVLPALSEQDAAVTQLHVSPGGDAVSLSVNASIKPPTDTRVSYRDLFSVLDDAEALMSEMAGAAAWFIPSPNTLIFRFEQAATIQVGSKQYRTDDEMKIELKVKKSLLKSNPQMIFSHLPTQVEPD